MACVRMVPREKRRKAKAERYREKRLALKKIAKNHANSYSIDEVMAAQTALQQLSRDSSPIRQRNRCRVCKRPRGVFRKFGLCRLCLRKIGMRGFIPGLVMSSW
ncbi:MAG: 30S ribosomal protein S14 [Gammaproteobacteria bacterium]